MYELPVIQKSAWDDGEIEKFVKDSVIPIRLAVNDKGGFPLICSLWYFYENSKFYCATLNKSKICRLLEADNRCAFEIAPNRPPYKGVRGQANVLIGENSGKLVLEKLISRYLGSTDSKLAKWLLSREQQERTLIVEPVWISAWDYSDRMKE
ncbi:MAG: pyridoxamine 5'-phosphate oxidase family protein [Candidatus Dadabacteria bacterium]|nr:pyridoxamine 5'-phosphate oxidase family protein [Candidatus Dadabacteria bacterium]NIX14954.1 pyridoxamine 5'-phosphate oxidase family protein [Candidatus Dadabacteria bacterium]